MASGGGPPPTDGLPFPEPETVFEAINFEEIGLSPAECVICLLKSGQMLGLALVSANIGANENPEAELRTYVDLIKGMI